MFPSRSSSVGSPLPEVNTTRCVVGSAAAVAASTLMSGSGPTTATNSVAPSAPSSDDSDVEVPIPKAQATERRMSRRGRPAIKGRSKSISAGAKTGFPNEFVIGSDGKVTVVTKNLRVADQASPNVVLGQAGTTPTPEIVNAGQKILTSEMGPRKRKVAPKKGKKVTAGLSTSAVSSDTDGAASQRAVPGPAAGASGPLAAMSKSYVADCDKASREVSEAMVVPTATPGHVTHMATSLEVSCMEPGLELEKLDCARLQNIAETYVKDVHEVLRNKIKIKGTHITRIKTAADTLLGIISALVLRADGDSETRHLRTENRKLRLQEDLKCEFNRPTTLNGPLVKGQGVPPPAPPGESTSTASTAMDIDLAPGGAAMVEFEKMICGLRRELMDSVANMMDGRLAALEGRLLPAPPPVRPPLRADRGQETLGTAPAPPEVAKSQHVSGRKLLATPLASQPSAPMPAPRTPRVPQVPRLPPASVASLPPPALESCGATAAEGMRREQGIPTLPPPCAGPSGSIYQQTLTRSPQTCQFGSPAPPPAAASTQATMLTPSEAWEIVMRRGSKKKRADKSNRTKKDGVPFLPSSSPPEGVTMTPTYATVSTSQWGPNNAAPIPMQSRRKNAVQPARPKSEAPKTAAIIVTLRSDLGVEKKGLTYQQVLQKAEAGISLRDLGFMAGLRFRVTASGARMMEVPGADGSSKADMLAERLRGVIGDVAWVTRPVSRVDLRLTGLADSATEESVAKAVADFGKVPLEHVRVGRFRRGPRGMGSVIISCPVQVANDLAGSGQLAIGWGSADVESLGKRPIRCYKCMGRGHTVPACPSESDRGYSCCHRCGSREHRTPECTAHKLKCLVCSEFGRPAEHVMGGGSCKPPLVKGKMGPGLGYDAPPRQAAAGNLAGQTSTSISVPMDVGASDGLARGKTTPVTQNEADRNKSGSEDEGGRHLHGYL